MANNELQPGRYNIDTSSGQMSLVYKKIDRDNLPHRLEVVRPDSGEVGVISVANTVEFALSGLGAGVQVNVEELMNQTKRRETDLDRRKMAKTGEVPRHRRIFKTDGF